VPDDRINAVGSVHINQAGNVYEGTALDLQMDAFKGQFDNANYRFLATGGHGESSRVDFIDKDRSVVHDATYTTCQRDDEASWEPSWVLGQDHSSGHGRRGGRGRGRVPEVQGRDRPARAAHELSALGQAQIGPAAAHDRHGQARRHRVLAALLLEYRPQSRYDHHAHADDQARREPDGTVPLSGAQLLGRDLCQLHAGRQSAQPGSLGLFLAASHDH
jgi:hypothetical protein